MRPDFRDYYDMQTAQENCRLIYVAITRAKYQCIVYKSVEGTDLNPYLEALEDQERL